MIVILDGATAFTVDCTWFYLLRVQHEIKRNILSYIVFTSISDAYRSFYWNETSTKITA